MCTHTANARSSASGRISVRFCLKASVRHRPTTVPADRSECLWLHPRRRAAQGKSHARQASGTCMHVSSLDRGLPRTVVFGAWSRLAHEAVPLGAGTSNEWLEHSAPPSWVMRESSIRSSLRLRKLAHSSNSISVYTCTVHHLLLIITSITYYYYSTSIMLI